MTGYVANNLCKNILRLKEDSNFLYRYLNFPKEFEGQVVTRNQVYLSDNWFDDAIQFGSFSDSKTIEWLKSTQLEVDNINTAIDASDNKKVNTLVNNLQKLVAQIDAGDLPEISPNC
jgi:putative lipoic acid-binding regulatory protein